jgi:hypothetical protein
MWKDQRNIQVEPRSSYELQKLEQNESTKMMKEFLDVVYFFNLVRCCLFISNFKRF